ncbi:MAG: peptidase prolyl oligopeptidase active site domain protein [Candidatus Solibacter sp.]|nr:peptidase prolyl oligopeptidase active site domain protein [Candidatus Solibacter sp.]
MEPRLRRQAQDVVYNTHIMSYRRRTLCVSAWLLATASLLPVSFAQSKRPLNHSDYDGWRSIVGERLSNDGKYLVYGLFPQEGDGEVVIRDLVTGKEQREAAGARPAPTPPTPGEENPTLVAPGAVLNFSADSKTLVFSTFPAKADTDKAKKDKKPAPKGGMVIVDLASGKATRVERVKRFVLPEKGNGVLAYQKEGPDAPAGGGTGAAAPPKPEGGDQQGGRGGRGGGAVGGAGRGPRPEFGSDLVVRNLADASERTIPDVVEFLMTDDGAQIVYAIAARDSAKNGVFAVKTGSTDAPASLLAGKGKYAKLIFDENQTLLAFLSDRDDAAAKQPKFKLYLWDRKAPAASVLVSGDMPGFRKEFAISDKGNLSFNKEGTRVFFACAPPPPEKKDEADAPADDTKAVVDLWSYKDDYIQPMQKVRAERDRNRTFIAAYLIPEHKIIQLADVNVETVTPSESAQWVLGTDDREYRPLADYDEHYADAYLIDAVTGARKLIASKQRGSMTWSPSGRYLLYFDGKDWFTVSVPDGKKVNLTASLGVKFHNEDTDTPSTPGPYGSAGWTKDGKSVLLYDRFDIWRVGPDGSGAKNITAGYGRAHDMRLRYIRTEAENPREQWIDGTKPVMLQGENQKTFATSLFRASLDGGEPKLLMASNKVLSAPIKAKGADVYMLTAQTFNEFPDLVTTDGSFKELRKVSDANPQKAQLLWGTSEIVQFKNADGVPLTGALYKPENFDPKKKYPLMVYIYERLSQNVNRFVDPRPSHNINLSYYVSNGYLILEPDIVYTTGFPGQSALKCVLPAVQAVVDKGFVDENAIGIQGHSWGGYQIAYMVTQTKRFRAVAAGAPVANMISAYDGIRWGTGLPRQFQYERTQSRIGGSIWQFPTRFIENSPIFWADRVQTPVMLLHNDGDDAVPWYQGVEFYLALRRLGKEVYLFDYNGEPHGLRKRPNQKDYTIRLQQYFDHYLKGAPAPAWMEKGVPYIERERTELSTMGDKK